MLKIHKSHSKKLIIIGLTSILSICTLLGISYFIYTPELSHAESITYEPPKETRTMDDITYMQEMTPEICQNSELNKQYTLTDRRDGNAYTVSRIKNQTNNNSNCWMTQNLRIIDKEISYLDSDVESGKFIIPQSNGSKFSTNSAVYQAVAHYDATNNVASYNWYTATAGSGTSDITNGNAINSICPNRWRLPTGGNNGELYNLISALKTKDITATPYNFVKSGYNGAFGTWGNYWSSTAVDTAPTYAYNLNFGDSVYPTRSSVRGYGFSVRCVARTEPVVSNNAEIAVNPTISLDVADEVTIEKTETNPSTANLYVKVTSNQKYSVGISTNDTNLTSTTSEVKIPAKSGLLNTTENGWGIKLKDDTNYTALTASLQTFYTASGAEIKTIPFTIGISTAPDIPNGEYSTDITITATQN